MGDRRRTAATTPIHPDLGTIDDFDAFVARAGELGLEVALDLALQCAPDHPWVDEHPEWFTTRADGTIAYAENPPKKYQDIYPLNFDNDPDGHLRRGAAGRPALDDARRPDLPRRQPAHQAGRVLGVAARARSARPTPTCSSWPRRSPGPAMMRTLGAIGFHQSYTYFTWRTAKGEIEDYLRELSHETDHLMRPNFFVNTPDILHAFLQYGGPAAFKIRAVLAATVVAELGRLRRLRAVRARRGQARAARSTSTRRSTRSGSATGTAADGRGPLARAVPHPAQRDPPRPPGAAAAAQPDRPHAATTTTSSCFSKQAALPTGRATW